MSVNKLKDFLGDIKKFGKYLNTNCEKSKDLQAIGGFEIPLGNSINLEDLKVESIFTRLDKILENNLLAISELNTELNTESQEGTANIADKYNKTENYKKIGLNSKDLGFLTKNMELSQTVEGDEKLCLLDNLNGLNILNVHLPSDGPKNKTIQEFLKEQFADEQFASLKDQKGSINVICGDTNIAEDKVINKNKKDKEKEKERGTQIALALHEIFLGETHGESLVGETLDESFVGGSENSEKWIVILSDIKINKNRRGFILRNQQPAKTSPVGKDDINKDGTIIAIKVKTFDKTIFEELAKKLKHFSVYDRNGEIYSTNELNALSFEKEEKQKANNTTDKANNTTVKANNPTDNANNTTDNANNPTEKVFIDHSVLFMPLTDIQKLVGIQESEDFSNKNLVVLNLGSMVNAGIKNWNTTFIKYQKYINNLDKALFEFMKKKFVNKEDISYEDICGSKSTDCENPIDKVKVEVSEGDFTIICTTIKNFVDFLNKSPTIDELENELVEKKEKYEFKNSPSTPTSNNLSNEKSVSSTGGARKIRSRRYRRKNRSARKSKIFVRRSTVRRSRRRPNKKRLKSRKQ